MEALTAKTGKGVKSEWAPKMDVAFDQIKAILAENTMLAQRAFRHPYGHARQANGWRGQPEGKTHRIFLCAQAQQCAEAIYDHR